MAAAGGRRNVALPGMSQGPYCLKVGRVGQPREGGNCAPEGKAVAAAGKASRLTSADCGSPPRKKNNTAAAAHAARPSESNSQRWDGDWGGTSHRALVTHSLVDWWATKCTQRQSREDVHGQMALVVQDLRCRFNGTAFGTQEPPGTLKPVSVHKGRRGHKGGGGVPPSPPTP